MLTFGDIIIAIRTGKFSYLLSEMIFVFQHNGGPIEAPLKPLEHCTTVVPRGLRGASFGSHMMPEEAMVSRTAVRLRMKFFQC